ncbi:TPA: ATP-binding protein [Yersinia enterocolitica]|nr:ATP-binding protein [Yersinia enterocolitica]
MICFQISESHQGTINVTSELDVGTTFTISLPKTLY